MSNNINTQWRITVAADTARARTELAKFAKVAQTTGMSMEEVFSNVKGAPVARTFNNMGRELNRMNVALQRSQVKTGQWNQYWRNSNNLIRYSKQLQMANSIAIEKTNGSMTSATAIMRRFNQVQVTTGERLAYMNRFFRQASTQSINMAKNVQWAGRQITVGFGVPFGLAMTGASLAFFKFEEQLVRFRKVFNDEVNDLSIEDAEERIINLANTMATQLGIARTEIMETSALFAQMGYRVEEIERLTKATTELAMLGETDAQEAGKLLRAYSASGFVDTLAREGVNEKEFEDYIKNMLNAIENNTGLSIASMVEAGMAQLVPLWSQMGVGAGIGESILAGMTEALGGRTSEAVTALKAIMQRVYDESAETTSQFATIGIDIDYLQDKYTDDFVGLIEELGDTLANNPDIQNNNKAVAETFGNLFGVRQANRAIAGLRAVSSAFDDNGDAVNDYGRALNSIQDSEANAARSARELAAQAESLGGQFKRIKEAIMIEASAIGESFLEMIMPLVKMVADVIESFSALPTSTKNAVMAMGLLVVAAGGVLTTFGVLAQAGMYMLRTIGFLLPKFHEFTEANFKQRLALDHVNQSLKSQKLTLEGMAPMWESIEQATRQAAQSNERLASSYERVHNAQSRITRGKPYGGTMGFDELSRRYGGQVAARNGGVGQSAHSRDVRALTGNYAAPLSGAARVSKQLMYSNLFAETNRDSMMMERQALITHRNQQSRAGRSQNGVKWRGGVGTAGALLGIGSMFVGGKAGDSMFAGSMGMQGVAMLMNPKVLDGVTKISDGLIKSAKAGGRLSARAKTAAASFLSMGGGVPALAVGIAAVAGSAYLIAKNMRESTEAANLLTNEFEYANTLGEELGMKLAAGGIQRSIINGTETINPEDFEQSSDAIKSLVADIQRVSNSDGDVQRIFRNLARDWMAGGATIEEVQSSLNDLEAQIGVEIVSVNTDLLEQTVRRDVRAALEATTTSLMLDTTLWNDIWGSTGPFGWGKEAFGSEGTALITSRASSLTRGMDAASGMNPDDATEFLNEMTDILDRQENMLSGRNREQYVDQFDSILAGQLGIPEKIAESLEGTSELMGFYYNSLITDQEYMNSLTAEQRDTIISLAQQTESYAGFSADVYSAFEGMDVLTQDVRQEANMLANALGRAAGYEGEDILWNATDVLQTGDMDLMIDYVDGLEDMYDNMDAASQRGVILKTVIDSINSALYEAPGAGHYAGIMRAYQQGRWGGPEEEETTEDPGSDAGSTDASNYASSFRSEMDRRRNEVVKSVLDNFDEVSKARLEALSDERDARIDMMEEQRDAALDAISDERDAELDAIDDRIDKIDEYMEKQKEIRDALQEQVDLNVALASGDRAKAAQIQNAMRFGAIEDMANTEKERLGEVKDSIREEYDERADLEKEHQDAKIEAEKELYETRMDNERDARDAARDSLEQRLQDLDRLFLGTEQGWNRFIDEVERESGQRITGSIRNGWQLGFQKVRNDMRVDSLWDQMAEQISTALRTGSTEGLLQGLHDPRVQQALSGHYNEMARQWTARGVSDGVPQGLHDPKVQQALAGHYAGMVRQATGSGVVEGVQGGITDASAASDAFDRGTWDRFRPEIDTGGGQAGTSRQWQNAYGVDFFHSGGAIGGGPARDVPAILQTGEYVIQRDAVKALGYDFLSKMNSAHKYHTGGSVSNKGGNGFHAIGHDIGGMIAGALDTTRGTTPMDPSGYGPRSWGREAANTRAARQFIGESFSGVRGAYASVDRGNPRSDHSFGKALDVMTTRLGSYSDNDEKAVGWSVANFFRNNPEAFGTKYIIWQDMISNGSIQNWRWRDYGRGDQGPTTGHFDHVHISFLHSGGLAGQDGLLPLMKGGRLKMNNVPAMLHKGETVLRAPVAKSLEAGIQKMSMDSGDGGGLTIQINEFHGTEENIDLLARKVGQQMARQQRRINPSRRIG